MKISILHLSELTGISRQSIKPRLDGLPFEDRGNTGHFYNSADALKLLFTAAAEGKLDPAQERAKLDRSKRQLIESQIEERSRTLIPKDKYERELTTILISARNAFQSFGGRLSGRLAHLDAPEICKILDDETYYILENLAHDIAHQLNVEIPDNDDPMTKSARRNGDSFGR